MIKSSFKYQGDTIDVEYFDCDDFSEIEKEAIQGVHAICKVGDKFAMAIHKKNGLMLYGGGVERGEKIKNALERELSEESNLQILKYYPVAYQRCTNSRTGETVIQARCYIEAKENGEFLGDPAGSIIGRELLSEVELMKFFNDWGITGEAFFDKSLQLSKGIKK